MLIPVTTSAAVVDRARLVDVLNYVSVDLALANPQAVHVRRASVAKAQKTAIDDALFRLERSALLALSSSQGEANIRVREAELTQKFVERARLIQPLGRVVTARDNQQRNVNRTDAGHHVLHEAFVTGDIFVNRMGAESLAHGCNCAGSMGAGFLETG